MGFHLLLLGVGFAGGADVTPPGYSAGEIGEFEDTVIVVVFSEQIVSALNDYAAGVTIKKNSVTQVISSAVRQGDLRTVYYTLDTSADGDDTITWQFSDALGDIADLAGNQLGDVSAQTAVNSINTRWHFNYAHNSSHLLTI